MLEVRDLRVSYEKMQVVHGVSFHVNRGETVTIIGANGAGKTSILRGLMGIAKTKGHVTLENKEIGQTSVTDRVNRGMILVPEGRGIFPNLTVRENLMLGVYRLSKTQRNVKSLDWDFIFSLFPRLKERRQQLAGTLSGGEQQMLALARALLAQPQLLMLDEPSLGLAPIKVQEVFNLIGRLQQMGTTILLVEQNAVAALRISHRAYVLESGSFVKEGKASDLLRDREVIQSYLGGSYL
ncbi:MAG: ABC transporter ATP-binding protein [Bdellovibrionaceae bacterium]|nr:ABC transporter ATP-binding protein [Pseudobdellovibrionaceae bacterium]MDW8190022.1 ABC transporter ATP-binding protein [Pseudobdellovibrionaceae bacterium]